MPVNYKEFSFQRNRQKIFFMKDVDSPDYITEKIEAEGKFYESDLLDWIQAQDIPPGDFVDVGANIGNHSIFFAKIMKRNTWSFEPYGKAYSLLNRNITRNGIKNIHTFDFGLSDRDTRAEIILPDSNNIGAAKVKTTKSNQGVLLRRGDEVLGKVRKISLIKIDVEGHEIGVLKGLRHVIEVHRPILLVECTTREEYEKNFSYISRLGYSPVAVFGATPMIVFHWFSANTNTARRPLEQLMGQYYEKYTSYEHTRSQYLELDRQINDMKAKNAELTSKVENLKRYQHLLTEIKKSRDYKIAFFISHPGALIDKVLHRSGHR